MPQSNTWKKVGSEQQYQNLQQEEPIILPNEDTFDLKEYVLPDIKAEKKSKLGSKLKPVTGSDPVFITAVSPKTLINPENIRSSDEQKYFYQPQVPQLKSFSNWFLVTFLMILIILGGLYFYFLILDRDAKISELERQFSTKTNPQVKGVRETITSSEPIRANSITVTPNSINTKNFSISTADTNFNFKNSETGVAVNYFNNQISSKNTFLLETKYQNKSLLDSVEILSAEKQSDLTAAEILQNVLKSNLDFEVDPKNFNSANGYSFSLLRAKDSNNHSKIYIGASPDFMYVINVKNESFSLGNTAKINNFLDNIVSKISFN